ncbi:MAG: putative ABC transporter ATP-binding protein [Turneriella sp.]|nr:putative ABC transporter ATP-binding protein [Turneriella sp.]
MKKSTKNKLCAVEISQLEFSYEQKKTLSIRNLSIAKGEHTLISGESGCGKSTLLNLISGIITGYSGSLCVLEKDYADMSSVEHDRFRAENIAVIFQQFNLIPYLTVKENILLGVKFSGKKISDIEVQRLLEHLQIGGIALLRAGTLSHGQQQRVAAARALAQRSPIILADEPTSALDEKNARLFLDLLFREASENNTTIIVVSHDIRHQKRFDRVIDFAKINVAHLQKMAHTVRRSFR